MHLLLLVIHQSHIFTISPDDVWQCYGTYPVSRFMFANSIPGSQWTSRSSHYPALEYGIWNQMKPNQEKPCFVNDITSDDFLDIEVSGPHNKSNLFHRMLYFRNNTYSYI